MDDNKNYSDKDNFQKMLGLAEFGAKRMEERRGVEFRIFISYITLLVLALYQLVKQQNLIHDFFKPFIQKDSISFELWEGIILYVLALCIHIIYVMWQVGLSIAMENDSYRRNFYLKKAQCISGCALEYEDKKDNVAKKIIIIQHYLQQFCYLWIIWEHWSRMLLIAIPTFLFTIVTHLFIKKTYPGWEWLSVIPFLIFLVLIVISVCQSRRRKCPANRSQS